VDDVAELDGGFEGPEGKGCGGVVVELHFYLSSGDVLRGIGIRRELLGIESQREGEQVLWEVKIVRRK